MSTRNVATKATAARKALVDLSADADARSEAIRAERERQQAERKRLDDERKQVLRGSAVALQAIADDETQLDDLDANLEEELMQLDPAYSPTRPPAQQNPPAAPQQQAQVPPPANANDQTGVLDLRYEGDDSDYIRRTRRSNRANPRPTRRRSRYTSRSFYQDRPAMWWVVVIICAFVGLLIGIVFASWTTGIWQHFHGGWHTAFVRMWYIACAAAGALGLAVLGERVGFGRDYVHETYEVDEDA